MLTVSIGLKHKERDWTLENVCSDRQRKALTVAQDVTLPLSFAIERLRGLAGAHFPRRFRDELK
jgi:hypothetical protein